MRKEFHGHIFEVIRGSDLERDGMFLEAQDPGGEVVAEVFYSDKSGLFTISTFRTDLPLPLIEWLSVEGRRLLVPV